MGAWGLVHSQKNNCLCGFGTFTQPPALIVSTCAMKGWVSMSYKCPSNSNTSNSLKHLTLPFTSPPFYCIFLQLCSCSQAPKCLIIQQRLNSPEIEKHSFGTREVRTQGPVLLHTSWVTLGKISCLICKIRLIMLCAIEGCCEEYMRYCTQIAGPLFLPLF